MPRLTYRIPEEDREQKTRELLRRWESWILIFIVGVVIFGVLAIALLGLLLHLSFNL